MDVIVTHTNADFDSLASLVAAKKLYPAARIVLPSLQERSVRGFVNLVRDVIKPEDERKVDFSAMRRLIVVDTRLKSRIGTAGEYLKTSGLKVHVYDHHPRRRQDIKAQKDHYLKCGATVTILLEIIRKRNIPISPLEATVFALGIYEDTGSLTFRTTTKKDIDTVGFLFSQGASLTMISSYLNREMNPAEMHLLSQLIDSTRIHHVAGIPVAVSSIVCTDQSADLALVTHKLVEVENYGVNFTLIGQDNRVQMNCRSRLESFDVSRIARLFGGGGHASAATATIKKYGLEQVSAELIKHLKTAVKSKLKISEIMNRGIAALDAGERIKEAEKIIEKLGSGVLPVVENGKLTGMISRDDIARAIKNGFAHAPVKGYMHRKVIFVKPGQPVEEVQRIIREKNIGAVPVISRGRLVGLVTRTDLVRISQGFVPERSKPGPSSEIKKGKAGGVQTQKRKRNFPPRIREVLEIAGRIADKNKVRAYLVGGFVRDMILGRKNFDMDIVVEGNALHYGRILANKLHARLKSYPRFKTAKLLLPEGMEIDIASARTEVYKYPAALPEVEASSLRQDLLRRDFTINTLALGLNREDPGNIIDFFGAQKDIREKRIRVLHDLSFVEDPTRILRAVRFEQRLDFTIDKHTENLILAAVDMEMFDRLHDFRIADELVLLFNEPHPLKVIKRMEQLHELKFIHPRIKLNERMHQLYDQAEDVLGWYNLSFANSRLERWIVYLLVVMDQLNAAQSEEVLNRFAFKKKARECLLLTKERGRNIVNGMRKRKSLKASAVFDMFGGFPDETVLFFMAKLNDVRSRRMLMDFLIRDAHIRLEINGNDLKSNTRPGPHYREVLKKTLYAKIDGKISGHNQELEFARKMLCM